MKKIIPILGFCLLAGGVFAQGTLKTYKISRKLLFGLDSQTYKKKTDYNLFLFKVKSSMYYYFNSNCDDIMTIYNPVSLVPVVVLRHNCKDSVVWRGDRLVNLGSDITFQLETSYFDKSPDYYFTFEYNCNVYNPINIKNCIYQIYTGKYIYRNCEMNALLFLPKEKLDHFKQD